MSDHLYSDIPDSDKFLTAQQIASPDSTILNNLDITYVLNEYPYTRYVSNGTSLDVFLSSGTDVYKNLVQSEKYFFAGWGRDHINTYAGWYDMSGQGNNATLEASLDAATVWGTEGLFTIPDPSGTTALAEIPAIDFDYTNGQSILIFWRGFATPEASDYALLGDTGVGTTTTTTGFNVIVSSAGKLKFWIRDSAGTLFASGTSTTTCFSASVEHSIGFVLDGVERKYCMWVDGTREAAFASNYLTFSSGNIPDDTTGGRTLKIGGNGRVVSSNQEGVACQTRAMHILRSAAGEGGPVDADTIILNLHKNSQKLVSAQDW